MKSKSVFGLLMLIACMPLKFVSQNIKTKQSVKTVVQQRDIYLNGGLNSSFGGKSRTPIQVTLPPNTKSWYYSFSTSEGASGAKNLKLALQLSSLLLDPMGITKATVSNIDVPAGSGAIDVYLLDEKNIDLFLEKVDNNGGTFYYKREGSAFSTKQGLIDISDFSSGTYYLGLKNPSTLDGINIHIEVVALIEELEQMSSEESEAITLGNFGWKAFERGDYDKCIEYSQKSLAMDNTLGFVHFNLALSYLVKGQTSDAITAYTKGITVTKNTSVPKQTFNSAMEDLKNNMDKFPSKADAKDILDLLADEAKNY